MVQQCDNLHRVGPNFVLPDATATATMKERASVDVAQLVACCLPNSLAAEGFTKHKYCMDCHGSTDIGLSKLFGEACRYNMHKNLSTAEINFSETTPRC